MTGRQSRSLRRLAALALGASLLAPLNTKAQSVPGTPAPSHTPLPGATLAQLQAPQSMRSRSVLSDPVVSSDTVLRARKVNVWMEGESQVLLLDGEVTISIGTYGFRGDRAVLRIDPEQRPGRVIRHLSAYIDNASPLRGGGPVSTQAPRLFVTASTTGSLTMYTDLLEPKSAASDPLVGAAQQRLQRHLVVLAKRTGDIPADASPIFGPQVDAARAARRQAIANDANQRLTQSIDRRVNELTQRADDRKRAELAELSAQEQLLEEPSLWVPAPGAPAMARAPDAPTVPGASGPASAAEIARANEQRNRILPNAGLVNFSAEKIVFDQNEINEPYIVLMGRVRVMYQDYTIDRTMTLTAENAVIFLSPQALGNLAQKQAKATDIRGVYLEDNVIATDGQYTIRAPRVFYDVPNNQALVLDAVLYTFDVQRQIPLYLRASKLQQESRTRFSATDAQITTSEFGEPHFAIAANRLTFEQETTPTPGSPTFGTNDGSLADGTSGGGSGGGAIIGSGGGTGTQSRWKFTGEGMGPALGGNPFKFWPKLSGYAEETPLRRVDVQVNHSGPQVKTAWDMFGLMGELRPDGVDWLARIDMLGEHGPGIGTDLRYDLPRMYGFLDAYFLGYDQGEDEIGDRMDVGHDDDQRGFGLWRHRQYLTNDRTWELTLEAAYVSDETFLEEFRRDLADESKPFETAIYLKKQEKDWAATFLASYDLNEFTPQTTLLQSPGYTVEKLPELGYYRVGTPLWNERLTYFTENRASYVRASVGNDRPLDRGFRNPVSQLLFGIPNTTPFDQAAEANGLPDDFVLRGDSRHEIQAPLKAGMFDIVPYVAGRVTAYNDEFEQYSSGRNDENARLWGSVGTRVHTQVSRTYDRVENDLLDLHRLRHIVEPSLDLFYAGTSIEERDLPVYDPEVENISDGFGTKLGLRNTLQTQRGGDGRWRNVDWLVVNTDLVLRGDEEEQDQKLMPRYYSYRPEYSLGGDHFFGNVAWQITDTLSSMSAMTYNIENDEIAQWRTGVSMKHTPNLTTHIDYTDLNILDTQILGYGFTYALTRKYSLSLQHDIDLKKSGTRNLTVELERKLPRWRLIVLASHDGIDEDTTVGFVLVPEGLGGGRRSSALLDRVSE